MFVSGRRRTVLLVFTGILVVSAALLGTATGLSIAVNRNTRNMDELMASRPAIPSRLLDINGELITEFVSDEKRDIVPITSLPENQLYAVLTREDAPFFEHTGFSVTGFFRAMYQNTRRLLTGSGSLQGASTITMQLAGARHADRSVISYRRKLKETWWAYQLERRFTKQEILEQYLNLVFFGHDTYGVEAASRFFFGHSAVENSPAESVMLAIQLAGSGLYSPLSKPDAARVRQREILNQMVEAGYVKEEEADRSFQDYWSEFDWSRSPTETPYFNRLAADRAPYFSEYIRGEIEQYLFGRQDIYRDGFVIHTTLNLDYQAEAEKQIARGLDQWNRVYNRDREDKIRYASNELVAAIDMLSLVFDMPGIHVADAQTNRRAREYLDTDLAPILDMMAMNFGMNDLKFLANESYKGARAHARMNSVETALVTLDNQTGHILAMIGGSEFNRNNQFNRAMDARVMPGSAFKPLYYSAAVSSGAYTPASLIYDAPRRFISPDGTPYVPGNYNGRFEGYILMRDALAKSLNVPAVTVLEAIGFDAAVSRSAALLGITDPREIGQVFDRVYPLGLGVLSVTPVQLARAYATMGNRGRQVEPLAVRYIEDRDGNIIVNPERDLRERQERQDMEVLSPQAAYIMTSLLQSAVSGGTLAHSRRSVNGFDGMPMAGKTGTTQNWTDAWTVGYSPYYTTSLWIGFDRRGNSLGRNQSGAAAAGPVWARFMKAIHEDLPRIDFPRPETGLVSREIDVRTGMIPEEDTEDYFRRYEVFIAGTEPRAASELTRFIEERNEAQAIKIAVDSSNVNPEDISLSGTGTRDLFTELGIPMLYLDDSGDPYGRGDETRLPANPVSSSVLD